VHASLGHRTALAGFQQELLFRVFYAHRHGAGEAEHVVRDLGVPVPCGHFLRPQFDDANADVVRLDDDLFAGRHIAEPFT
jgi:hypothetical protein